MTVAASRPAAGRRGLRAASAVALLWGYAVLVHYGVGPPPDGVASAWWQPRAFFFGWGVSDALLGSAAPALVTLTLPALLLAAALFAATRSALLRTLAVAGVLAVALFTYYGAEAPFVWEFFRWRGTAVMLGLALVVAAAATAPLLAASWLQRGWPLRLAWYVPIAAALVALERNATGTDPALPFSISPWPVIPVFGLEIAASILSAAYALIAVAFFVYARVFRPEDGQVARRRARTLAAGAALAGLPLVAGQVWAGADYRATREGSAREITGALAAYYAREQIYPDALEDLIDSGDLETIPTPRIGFLSDADFVYQNFGTSYILEFWATRWVQCAYNPPWSDEDELLDPETLAETGDDGDEDTGQLEESWSCPAQPPELW